MVCDSLFGRIVREFEPGQPTMFAVLRARSLASLQRSQPSKKHRVTDNVQLSVGTPDDDISPLEDQGKLRAYFACFRALGAQAGLWRGVMTSNTRVRQSSFVIGNMCAHTFLVWKKRFSTSLTLITPGRCCAEVCFGD